MGEIGEALNATAHRKKVCPNLATKKVCRPWPPLRSSGLPKSLEVTGPMHNMEHFNSILNRRIKDKVILEIPYPVRAQTTQSGGCKRSLSTQMWSACQEGKRFVGAFEKTIGRIGIIDRNEIPYRS
jgi:hypothetical protein